LDIKDAKNPGHNPKNPTGFPKTPGQYVEEKSEKKDQQTCHKSSGKTNEERRESRDPVSSEYVHIKSSRKMPRRESNGGESEEIGVVEGGEGSIIDKP